jgi:Dyp-type peroxidase family
MPLDLSTELEPIDEKKLDYQEFLADLQGNILNGHGRDYAVHLFLKFLTSENSTEQEKITTNVKKWISSLADSQITTAISQLEASELYKSCRQDAGLFTHFALTASGYDYLQIPKAQQPHGANLQKRPTTVPDPLGNPAPFYADAYQEGMKLRQSVLLDPPAGTWELGFRGPIDALVILADDNPADLAAAQLLLKKQLHEIATIVVVETGQTLRRQFATTVDASGVQKEFGNVVEHFGYADGVSQPAFLQKQLEGVSSEYWKHPGAPLKLVLIDDPNGTKNISFGSFLVFRKLEQNVKGFKTAEAELAKSLKLPTELAGAMAVGRYEDGTPLVLQPGDGGWAEPNTPKIPNDFNYSNDTAGLKCPFHAHVRKSNPRLESVGSFAQNEQQELGHRIARRGITYGGPLSTGDLDDLPESGVGLLFMCYQSDIWEQFEFIQRFWCNNPNFLEPGNSGIRGIPANPNYDKTGLDAVIGQKQGEQFDPVIGEAPQPPQNWPQEWDKPTIKPTIEPENQFGQFVTLKGGEYFFSPSITFLKNLPSLSFTAQDQDEQPAVEEDAVLVETV